MKQIISRNNAHYWAIFMAHIPYIAVAIRQSESAFCIELNASPDNSGSSGAGGVNSSSGGKGTSAGAGKSGGSDKPEDPDNDEHINNQVNDENQPNSTNVVRDAAERGGLGQPHTGRGAGDPRVGPGGGMNNAHRISEDKPMYDPESSIGTTGATDADNRTIKGATASKNQKENDADQSSAEGSDSD